MNLDELSSDIRGECRYFAMLSLCQGRTDCLLSQAIAMAFWCPNFRDCFIRPLQTLEAGRNFSHSLWCFAASHLDTVLYRALAGKTALSFACQFRELMDFSFRINSAGLLDMSAMLAAKVSSHLKILFYTSSPAASSSCFPNFVHRLH